MSQKSSTPETDAEVAAGCKYLLALACRLERERDGALRELRELRRALAAFRDPVASLEMPKSTAPLSADHVPDNQLHRSRPN